MIIIPARLSSSRLKNKIMLPIGNVPMFIATANRVRDIDEVVIAVDDDSVANTAKSYGFRAVLTKKEHQSGTDRIFEAVQILGLDDNEIVINVQADEPFIEPENIFKFKNFCNAKIKDSFMFSCFKNIGSDQANDPNLVKVVIDFSGYAVYFSRSLIPYPRSSCDTYKAHIGIYGYNVGNLREFCSLPFSFLENTEKLEQLRALESGKRIAMLEIESKSIGIDVMDDYKKALEII